MPVSPEPRDPTQLIHPRRPFALRLVFWMLVLWTVLGWLRFSQALQQRELILAYTTSGIFAYLVGAGVVWGVAGLPALWGLTFRTSWARMAIGVNAVLYPAIYWFERLVLWQDENSQGNWLFMLALTLIWLGVSLWGLFGKAGRPYFMDKKVD